MRRGKRGLSGRGGTAVVLKPASVMETGDLAWPPASDFMKGIPATFARSCALACALASALYACCCCRLAAAMLW